MQGRDGRVTRISELLAADDQRALLEGLFVHAPIAFQIYGADGHCLLVNDAFRALFGSEPPREYDILKDEIAQRHGLLALVHRAFAGETVRLPPFWYDPHELRQVEVKEARGAAIELTLVPLLNAAGKTSYVALCFKDVTPELRREQDRARISRDLHDDVATELTALVWKTRELSAVLPEGPIRGELVSFEARLRGALSDLRNVVVSLRRSKLSVQDALQQIEGRCRELAGGRDFVLEVTGQPAADGALPQQDEVPVDTLPICFELVQNAAVHSGCRRIAVKLELGPDLVLTVCDDGRGIDAEVAQRSDGGLLGVRQRVTELGGNIQLTSDERGTTIAVTLPR